MVANIWALEILIIGYYLNVLVFSHTLNEMKHPQKILLYIYIIYKNVFFFLS